MPISSIPRVSRYITTWCASDGSIQRIIQPFTEFHAYQASTVLDASGTIPRSKALALLARWNSQASGFIGRFPSHYNLSYRLLD